MVITWIGLSILLINSFPNIKKSIAKAIEVNTLSFSALNGSIDQNAQPVMTPKINTNERNSINLAFGLPFTDKPYFNIFLRDI